MGGRWREEETELPRHAYAALEGTSRFEAAQHQDIAAGSHAHRMLDTGDPPKVLARIRFVKRPRTRRVYAYLVWQRQRRHELLLHEAIATTRHANLAAAWQTVHQHKLLTPEGRTTWISRRGTDKAHEN